MRPDHERPDGPRTRAGPPPCPERGGASRERAYSTDPYSTRPRRIATATAAARSDTPSFS